MMSAAAALLLFVLPAQTAEQGTTVSAPRPTDIDDARGALAGDALALLAAEDALLALGAGVVHDGGPLSPSRVFVRGLSSSRLAVAFDGVPLSDPSGATLDAAALPWAFADALTVVSGPAQSGPGTPHGALGGAIRLTSRPEALAAVRARALFGALSTARVQGRVSAPLSNERGRGALVVGLDAASTRGDFSFLPTGAAPGAEPASSMVRHNNDHQRASGLAAARTQLGELHFQATLLAAGHRGGIPGFALAPTRELRGEDGLLAGRLAVQAPVGGATLGASVGARGVHRATQGPSDPRSAVQSSADDLHLSVARVPLGDGAVADLQAGVGVARAIAGPDRFERVHSAASIGARAALGPIRLRAHLDGAAFTDTRPLLAGELRIEAGEALRASLSAARASRPPSLEEMYAPAGFVFGTPALRPELAHDLEAAIAYQPGRIVSARAVAFAGRIDDAIVYQNRNAYQIAPANTGAAWRAGLDGFAIVEPAAWLRVAATMTLLASRLESTDAPLPLAPPWAGHLALRGGAADTLNVEGVLRARGPASANIYGTLTTPASAFVDLLARVPLAPGVWLSAALQNALDVRDARDQNQLPLPGRLWLLGLELAS